MAKLKNLKFQDALKIYSEAQKSAEHHDSMYWQVASILLAGSFALLGFVVQSFTHYETFSFIFIVSIFGIFILLCLTVFNSSFNGIVNLKYKICQQIEKDNHKNFKYQPHLETKKLPHFQTPWMLALIFSLFAIWLYIIVYILSYFFSLHLAVQFYLFVLFSIIFYLFQFILLINPKEDSEEKRIIQKTGRIVSVILIVILLIFFYFLLI